MKGKIKLLGHIGLVLFVLSALMLALVPAVPVAAATVVTEVWVDFEDANTQNAVTATANVYLIHFKATTALSRGVDTVTVTWPDGSTTMGGYAFTVATTMTAGEVDFSTNYESTARSSLITWSDCTATPIVGGKRSKVTTPIDIAAGSDVWVRFASNDITSASTAGGSYKVYVVTSKDTTPVLSSAFGLDGTALGEPAVTISPTSAGAAAEYVITLAADVTTGLAADTDTVTIQFPVGTTVPSSITASNVQFGLTSSAYTSTGTAPVVDQDKRTVTAVTSKTVSDGGDLYIKITSAAGVCNPTEAATGTEALYKVMCSTSQDRQFKVSAAYTVAAAAAGAIKVCNGEVGLDDPYYSDDATMVSMYSSQIYVTMVDVYGNAKVVSGGVTVTPTASSGALYKNSAAAGTGTFSSASTLTVDAATPDEEQTVYFRGSTAGTHTLSFAASGYTTVTWTFKVCPEVSLYDSSNNLIKTYGPTATILAAETNTTDGGNVTDAAHCGADYINDAITAAMAGDTVKLGDGTYEVKEASDISLNKKITLTSVNGASSTTIRNIDNVGHADLHAAIIVGISGTATNPVIIDSLTFQRLRAGTDICSAIVNDGNDYVTVRNCVFNNIEPDRNSSFEGVIWTRVGHLTSITISNNTFNSCVTTWPNMGAWYDYSGCITFATETGHNVTGVTISGNTLTNCGQYGIALGNVSGYTTGASITNNTITNGQCAINLSNFTASVSITGNTITNPYSYGIYVESTSNTSLVIKNNTITGCAGEYYMASTTIGYGGAIVIESATSATDPVIQYNDIYNTSSASYAIKVDAMSAGSGADCKYNWFGNATGPAYTALTGASISKSNPNGTGDKITDKVTYYPWLHKSLANVVADNASYQACTMKLVLGSWNTLSTPVKLISEADAIDELIPAANMTIGYYYDATGWHQITTGYVLNPCDAVYIKIKSTASTAYVLFKFDASAFSTPSKALAAGWNLISLASLDATKTVANTMACVDLTSANLPGWSQVVSPSMNAAQTDIYGVVETAWAESAGEAANKTMQPGLGYWAYMQNAATLAGFEITPIAPDLD
jgi:hypothetical protein